MGYTHYWTKKRDFTAHEWKLIVGEAKRIVAKAARGTYYSGKEDAASQAELSIDGAGCRTGFAEQGAWRTFPHPDQPIPHQGTPIAIAGPWGTGKPTLNNRLISLNGKAPHEYETFTLRKELFTHGTDAIRGHPGSGFCKTEYRPYDAVVVSILTVAQTVAPDAIEVTSDGGESAIRYMF